MAPHFLHSKEKKRKQRKKGRVSKQKLLKDCHQGQNVTVLAILERLEFKNFSSWPTMVADNTFSVLWPLHLETHFTGPDNAKSFKKFRNILLNLRTLIQIWF